MKKLAVFFAVAVVASMLFLVGCSSRDDDLVGRWAWDIDSSYMTTFNADGTGTHAVDWGWGYGTTFTWRTRGNRILWSYPGHPEVYTEYSISGRELRMVIDADTTFIYIRQ